jgi:hypothetical protein
MEIKTIGEKLQLEMEFSVTTRMVRETWSHGARWKIRSCSCLTP